LVLLRISILNLHRKIESLAISYTKNYAGRVFVKVKTNNIQSTISQIEKTYKSIFPESSFDYSFLDEAYNTAYKAEMRMSGLFQAFTLLAIIISCLGLFGLASFMVEQRTKEIGVRKVLGSSVSALIVLLSKEFTKWVVISNLIAFPISYLLIDKWLSFYAYKTDFGFPVFLLSGSSALVISLFTVSYQTIKAANSNPIKALKYE